MLVPLALVEPGSAATASLKSSRPSVMANESFALTGRLSTSFARPVVLKYKSGTSWVKVAAAKTSSTGTFRFATRTKATRTYKVFAVAAKYKGRSYQATGTPTRRVPVVGQGARIVVLPKISQRGGTAAKADAARAVGQATFTPARAGRNVVVERYDTAQSTWVPIRSTVFKQDATGSVYFVPATSETTTVSYRARAGAYNGAVAKTSPTANADWRLTFDESFTSLDRTLWMARATTYSAVSKRTCSKTAPSLARVNASGELLLTVKPDPNKVGQTCTWKDAAGKKHTSRYFLNAHVGTVQKYSFRYGVAAARVWFQEPRGMHGSFWMNDSGRTPTGTSAEIDAAEYFGKGYPNGGMAQFLHSNKYGTKVGGVMPRAASMLGEANDTWYKRYHVFSVEWSPNGYVFRIDGKQAWSYTKKDRYFTNKEVMLILSNLASDWELKDNPTGRASGTVKVDWVRVWQRDGGAGNLSTRIP